MWAGVIVIAVGAIWIAREAGADIPHWLTGGPIWMVGIGLFIGARSNFRNWFWLIPFGVGTAMIVNEEFFWRYDFKQFIWPVVVVLIGLFMIFRPKRSRDAGWVDWRNHAPGIQTDNDASGQEDVIDSVAIFGHIRKNILSKNFRGGEVVSFLGGTEINLTQADLTKPAVLEMTQVFGGSKLIVPSNWTIQSTELVSVFGGVDDKRMVAQNVDPTKILILKGTNVFGGLEIKSF
jgi:predicted membrane protein